MIPPFSMTEADIKDLPDIADVEDARNVLAALPLLAKLATAMKEKPQAWADANGGVPVKDGVWGKVQSTSTNLVADKGAIAVLESYFGMGGSNLALSTEVSAASIQRAVEASGFKPVGPKVIEIVEAIKAVGSFTTSPKTSYAFVKTATKAVA